jgi:hypothetical protein
VNVCRDVLDVAVGNTDEFGRGLVLWDQAFVFLFGSGWRWLEFDSENSLVSKWLVSCDRWYSGYYFENVFRHQRWVQALFFMFCFCSSIVLTYVR